MNDICSKPFGKGKSRSLPLESLRRSDALEKDDADDPIEACV